MSHQDPHPHPRSQQSRTSDTKEQPPAPHQPHQPQRQPEQHLPPHWPPNLAYIPRPIYAYSIPSEVLQVLHTAPPLKNLPSSFYSSSKSSSPSGPPLILPSASLPPTPHPSLAIQRITNTAHPACGQSGLFATQDIAPDTFLLLYAGLVYATEHSQQPEDAEQAEQATQVEESNYELSLYRDLRLDPDDPDAGFSVSIDALAQGNEARFVNDYRGVPLLLPGTGAGAGTIAEKTEKSAPNVEFRELWIRWSKRARERERERERVQRMTATTAADPSPSTALTDPNPDPDPELAHTATTNTNPNTNPNTNTVEDQAPPPAPSISALGQPWDGAFERCMGLFVLSSGSKRGTRRARGVRAGEELLVSYGKGFWRGRQNHHCHGEDGEERGG